MTRLSTRVIAMTAAATVSSGLLVSGALPASAFDAGPLASVTNEAGGGTSGTNIDVVQMTAPAPCDAAATRHVTKILSVSATNPAQQALADAWIGDNLYAPVGVGLPGPLSPQASNSWQGLADGFGQQLVPGVYHFVLRCQNNVGTTIYEEWSGGVVFTSPTAWTGFVGADPPGGPPPPPPGPSPTPDRVAPTASLTGPRSATTLGSAAVVSWSGADNVGVTSYDVRYRTAAWNRALGGYTYPAAWQATGATTTTRAMALGSLYCFSARSRDAAGNVSAWTAERCTARPLDDRSLAATGGFAKKTGKAYFAGTVAIGKASGAKLTRTGALAGRVALVATKGKGMGKVGIYYNGKRVTKVNLKATKTSNKVVIALPRLSRNATIVIKVLSSGKTVAIDGLVLARR